MDARRWEEVQAAFDKLVQLDASGRATRLAALSSTDPELHAAIESLLVADAEASVRLAPLDNGFLSQATAAPDPLGLAGRTVSHFRVVEPLGAGGMGLIYRADDTALHRTVALKFLRPQLGLDATARARFLREAHAAAALDHVNLCPIHEVGATDDGLMFLAMPLYGGATLSDRLEREGPLAVADALAIARQIVEGLACAHVAGIVHRDLKPSNVMLLPDGTVKILDFGLAKARNQSLTETGAVLGTVLYMAPEQIRGDKVDARADLWALGVLLYEILTGRTPFEGEQQIAVAQAILHNAPVPPTTHRADVPVMVEDVVLRLLEKNPDKRYAVAADLLADLARVGSATEGLRHVLQRRWRRARNAFSSRRGRRLVLATAMVVIAAGSYAAVALKGAAAAVAPARTAIAVLPFRDLSADSSHAYFANGLQDEIINQLYKVPGLKVIGRGSVMAYIGGARGSLKQIGEQLGVGSIVDATVQISGSRVRVNVQLVDAATETPLLVQQYDRTLDDAFALQSDIARQIVPTVGVVLGNAEQHALADVPTAKSQAYLLYLQAKEIERRRDGFFNRENLDTAGRLYRQAIALDSSFALAHAALSGTHAWMYIMRFDMSPERLELQRAEAETALRLAPTSPEAHVAMSGALDVGPHSDHDAAHKEMQLAQRYAPNDARMIARNLSYYRQTGNWDEYEKTFLKAVDLDPRNADFLRDYGGDTHVRMGRWADALHWYERAASITGDTSALPLLRAWANVHWKGDLQLLHAWMSGEGGRVARRDPSGNAFLLASYWYVTRQPDSMLAVLRMERQRVWQGSFQFEPVALWRAQAHEMRGDQRAARAQYDSALALADSGVRTFRDDYAPHWARAVALAGLGRRAEALEEVQKVRDNFLFRDLWLREDMLFGIAGVYAKLGDAEATVATLEEVLSQKCAGKTVNTLRFAEWDRVRDDPRFQALLKKYANHPNVRS